ncbi:unnamed protein product [Polarella glacialis]|uniref:Glycosyl hydrolase family 30 TIM-barrel domain-containing protein n=1 Tax=Polarella glacialis TaxID=89957 RepID=A0A813K7K3_POLGL|nr:unnamed protein product [Polarella glacialis]
MAAKPPLEHNNNNDNSNNTRYLKSNGCLSNVHDNCYFAGYLNMEERAQSTWALYFSKFIDAYEALGIPIWGLTVQNEPLSTTCDWPSMFYTAQGQSHFLANHLGPLMRERHPGLKLMIHDDQTIHLMSFAGQILQDPEAAQYVDGVAYHWYSALEATFENSPAHRPFPFVPEEVGGGAYVAEIWSQLRQQEQPGQGEKFMLMTEACNGYVLGTEWVGPRPGDWGYGYAYSHDILWQLRNGAAGWTDWNLFLDAKGGPNLAGNFVDAPILVDGPDVFHKSPSFFHLAHFSTYVLPGSRRVNIKLQCGAKKQEYCQAVAFVAPDGGYAVVVITNDEITVGPIAGVGGDEPICFGSVCFPRMGGLLAPALAKGQGASLTWTIRCGTRSLSGSIPWKAIQTVIIPCS